MGLLYFMRPASVEDLSRLKSDFFKYQGAMEKITEEELNRGLYFVATNTERDRDILGIIGLEEDDKGKLSLKKICVCHGYRGEGLGTAMVKNICKVTSKTVYADVFRLDPSAKSSWLHSYGGAVIGAGFKVCLQDVEKYYEGINCYFACKEIKASGVCDRCKFGSVCSKDIFYKESDIKAGVSIVWDKGTIKYSNGVCSLFMDWEVGGESVKLDNFKGYCVTKEDILYFIDRVVGSLYCDVILYLNDGIMDVIRDLPNYTKKFENAVNRVIGVNCREDCERVCGNSGCRETLYYFKQEVSHT